jgi:hydroxymethylpyrimidine kinase/phosphomethylpyrimidine kinase/thiamine-phosphate diphosphorylase
LSDIPVEAVKTGMLATADIIRTVAVSLAHHGVEELVVDPVMVAKSGDRLLADEAVGALKEELLPLARVVTPNLHETTVLTGIEFGPREDLAVTLDKMCEAAERIVAEGPDSVIVKGGHVAGQDLAVDVFFDGHDFTYLQAQRVDTPHTHGTGCTFSSAVAAGLARGWSLHRAVREAKGFISWAIEHGFELGDGHGPTNHLTSWLSMRAVVGDGEVSEVLVGTTGAERRRAVQEYLAVYVVTDADLAAQAGYSVEYGVEEALEGGATAVQLRAKGMDIPQLVELGKSLRELTRKHGALFIVNDRVDVALAVDADGVHLGQQDMPLSEARNLMGANAVIGVSVRTPEQALAAAAADYFGVGPMFATDTKTGAGEPLPAERIEQLRAADELAGQTLVSMPVVGIGGITPENARRVIQRGADGVAVISAVFGQEDPQAATRRLAQEVNAALRERN